VAGYDYCQAMIRTVFAILTTLAATLHAADAPLVFNDRKPQRYELTTRASQIDARARAHPEIDFVFEKGGKSASRCRET